MDIYFKECVVTFAVVFPGQGAQSVGMLAELAAEYSSIQATFAEASEVLGQDLWQLAQNGPAETLSDTRITQPLMFTSGVAIWRVMRESGLPTPSVFAGHSLGEFSAMVAADILSFADGLTLVKRRAELMASAVPEGQGGMAALIGMDDQAVIDLCASVSGERISEAVNFNAPGQVAISGHLDALEKTVALAREQGCRKALMLAVSVPNHSSLMRDAGEELAKTMDTLTFSEPSAPLVQNATARAADDLDSLIGHLKAHVYNPVYWTRTVEALRDVHGVTTVIEAGPGKVLTGLGKRIDRSLTTLPVDSTAGLVAALAAVGVTAA
ncbi:ACP S-malonyltransferase [Granulosicoccus antarcticus]|uniref:Malonyl CoA-acyl carrier protein transacylase n=1 Tax=Granulosicoccus antarcticus IMCC3135 TaxID=1192854 RepID=A0A2Z2NTJ4_9GAMM|nr:ACP S-malonyltransferase [Granulosicoccus antarcticus]ASJ74872.1 Malonyl CoA-acyl carrier protein transacylase [Granulosicoccus antarcticus IMCC3135]